MKLKLTYYICEVKYLI